MRKSGYIKTHWETHCLQYSTRKTPEQTKARVFTPAPRDRPEGLVTAMGEARLPRVKKINASIYSERRDAEWKSGHENL